MKILVVEDERPLSDSICNYLEEQHFICETAYNIEQAAEKIRFFDYDCVLLDISLPGGNGLQLLEILKNKSVKEGVVIISAKNALGDKIKGLQTGADDYLTKPFHLAELSARIDAVIRRRIFSGNSIVKLNDLELDVPNKRAKLHNHFLDLTRKEFDLLLFFASNKNKVITKSAIISHLWGDNAGVKAYNEILYTHIKNIRKKLKRDNQPDYIQSVYGLGYRLSTEHS